MKKLFKRKDETEIAQDEPNLIDLLQEIKQQLIFLEKKVDALASQPQEKRREHSYGRDRGERDGGFREKSFSKAVCAECHKECEVPFRPTGDRPVYCKECFAKRDGGSFEGGRDSRPRSGGFDRERSSGRSFERRPGGGESRGFGKRKPSTFPRRKERF